jgi:hypothetical protein
MKLIDLDDNYNVVLDPEVFLLKDFQALRDDRKDPERVLAEIGYLYFFFNPRSEFQFQTDKQERHKDVLKRVGLPEDWTIDAIMQACIDTYLYLSQTISGKLLESAYLTVDKIKDQLNKIDLNERDKSDKPIWNIKQIVDTSKVIPQLMETIRESEKAYIKGQAENDQLRGNKIKTLYEDGFSMAKD